MNTTVEAVKKGTGIKLQSDNAIITGFKGNMFRVDTDINNIYTSVFYDNVMYGSATLKEASFVGGAVITTNSRDIQYNCYTINSSNNELTLTANIGSPITIKIPEKTYSVDDMCNFLNIQFANNGMGLVATKKTIPSGEFEGIILTSTVKGLTSKVDVDSTSSAYDTLFRKCEYTDFEYDASIDSESDADSTGSITGGKKISDENLPIKIVSGDNDKFSLIIDTSTNGNINSATYTIKLEEGEYKTSSALLAHINDKLNGAFADIGYKDKIDVSYSSDNKIILKGKEVIL